MPSKGAWRAWEAAGCVDCVRQQDRRAAEGGALGAALKWNSSSCGGRRWAGSVGFALGERSHGCKDSGAEDSSCAERLARLEMRGLVQACAIFMLHFHVNV